MKNLSIAVLSLIFIFSLSACGTTSNQNLSPSVIPTTIPTTATLTASPTISPTVIPPVTPTPIPTVTPKETPIATPNPIKSPKAETTTKTTSIVKILSVTSPAARNSTATLKAKVAPGATASIVVHYKSGASKAAGLEPKKADSNGNVSWSWHVGGNTTLGNWRITVSSGNSTAETTFEVVH